MKILVDADFSVYKCTAAAEDEIDFGDDVIVVTSRSVSYTHLTLPTILRV